jgi:hypothetical protein
MDEQESPPQPLGMTSIRRRIAYPAARSPAIWDKPLAENTFCRDVLGRQRSFTDANAMRGGLFGIT